MSEPNQPMSLRHAYVVLNAYQRWRTGEAEQELKPAEVSMAMGVVLRFVEDELAKQEGKPIDDEA